jgi:hypothetical protein
MNNKDYAAGILYKFAVSEEKEWRKNEANEKDVATLDKLLHQLGKLGYRYKYLADLTHRNITDMEALKIIMQYIGNFEDEGISAELVGVIGIKGNISATETIINNYLNSSNANKQSQAGYYDNALFRIKDKRYISSYLDLLKKPEDANRFPLTMIMIARWHIDEAKPYFLRYIQHHAENSNLAFIAMEALSYYLDTDGAIAKEIEKRANSNDKNMSTAAKKALKQLEKNNSHKCRSVRR